MTDAYLDCHARLAPIEGWISNHAADKGKLTICGIARAAWPDDPIWEAYDKASDKLAFLRSPEAQAHILRFYWTNFWVPMHCEEFPYMSWELFEFSVNAGPGGATMALQTLLNCLNRGGTDWEDLPVKGQFGPRTVVALTKACQKFGEPNMALLLNMMQFRHYINITLANPTQEVFTVGWVKKRILYTD